MQPVIKLSKPDSDNYEYCKSWNDALTKTAHRFDKKNLRSSRKATSMRFKAGGLEQKLPGREVLPYSYLMFRPDRPITNNNRIQKRH